MAILYGVVARGVTVLAKYAACTGNFAEVTEQILAKISPDNNRLTYAHGSYLFHYVCEDRIVYMCITDEEFDRSRAFLYLADVQRRFKQMYGDRVNTALPFAMNTEFAQVMASQMKHFAEAKDVDQVSRVQSDLDELKDVMVKNIDNIAARGERLELLVDKTEQLNNSSVSFRTTSRNLARSMFWKNIKLTVIIVVVCIVVVYFVVSMACGGLAWKKCV